MPDDDVKSSGVLGAEQSSSTGNQNQPIQASAQEPLKSAQEQLQSTSQPLPNPQTITTPDAKPVKVADKMNVLAQIVIPIATALAGIGMYAYSQWYVGEVQVKTPKDYNQIEIHVFNDKGNEQIFHSNHFQLSPDHYRFEIAIDQHPNIKHEKKVTFGEKVVLYCDVLPPVHNQDYMAGEEAAQVSPQTASARDASNTKSVAPAKIVYVHQPTVAPSRAAASVVSTSSAGTPDPAAPKEAESVALGQLCYAERRLRNLPLAANDARLQALLNQLGAIQSALNAKDTNKACSLIKDFVSKTDALVADLASSGVAPGVKAGGIKALPAFLAIDDLIFARLNETLGIDAPSRIGPFMPQRVKLVFRLRALEHQGKNVSAQRGRYAQLDTYLSKHSIGMNPDDFARVKAEVKAMATELEVSDLPPFPPNLPIFSTAPGKVASGSGKTDVSTSSMPSSVVPEKKSSPAAKSESISSKTDQVKPAAASAASDAEAIALAKLCASVRQLKNQPIAPEDARLQPLMDQLTTIKNGLNASDKTKVYPLIDAFAKSVVMLQAQLRRGEAVADQNSASLRDVQQLNDVEDFVFNRFQELFGPDAPARIGTLLVPRVQLLIRLRNLESQGKDVSAQRRQYEQMNDFLNKQKRFSPAIGRQLEPQVKDLENQLRGN